MAITYPRALPGYRLVSGSLALIDNVSASPSGKGSKINLSQVNDPLWQFRLSTGPLPLATAATWEAWKSSLRGGFRSFIAFDPRRRAPLAYEQALAAGDINAGWAGTATVATLGAAGALGLTGLPAGYQFTAGDRVGIEQGGRYGYYEIIEGGTASGGGAATVTVAPFLHTAIFTSGATARLWRPVCELVIDWTSWADGGEPNYPTISFEAWQTL